MADNNSLLVKDNDELPIRSGAYISIEKKEQDYGKELLLENRKLQEENRKLQEENRKLREQYKKLRDDYNELHRAHYDPWY